MRWMSQPNKKSYEPIERRIKVKLLNSEAIPLKKPEKKKRKTTTPHEELVDALK